LTVGTQAGGALTVNASETISLVEGTNFLVSGTFGSGNSGNVAVNANTSILLRDGSQIGAATRGAGRAGDITLTTGQLILQEGSRVDSFTTEIADNPTNHAGNITVTASQSAEFNGISADGQISGGLFARTDGTGNAGQVTIMTPSLRILNGAIVAAFTNPNSTGDAGNITVSNANLVELSGNSPTGGISRLTAVTDGSGNAGKVTIDTRQLLVQDGGEVSAFTASNSSGNAGNVTIDAEESVTISGTSSTGQNSILIASTLGTGRAGNVRITTPQFIARDGGQVETLTTRRLEDGSNLNRAGDITITASESVELSGKADFNGLITDEDILNSGLFASTEGTGDAGNITINTPKLTVRDEAVVVTSTEGSGNAGRIEIQPPEGVELDSSRVELLEGGALVTVTSSEALAGNVEIDTGRFVARDGSGILTLTGGSGQAGEIEIDASESVELTDSGSGLIAWTLGQGDAGTIEIDTEQFKLTDEALVSVASFNLGQPGTIEIEAERIFQENNGSLLAFARFGRGGNITLEAEETRLEGLSNVLAFGFLAQEGNIDIATDRLLLFRDGSRVITRDADPKGGNINVETRDEPLLLLYRCNSCIISASGTLTIADELPTPELAFTPILDVNSLIRDDICEVGVGSEFIIPGSGGTPPSPLEPFSGTAVTAIDWIEFLSENIATIPQPENAASEEEFQEPDYKPLVEAQGWIVGENGQIILVADSPTVTPAVPALNRIDCTDE
jgi:large exoprotein involved in heme utilization and adhesion